jgi:hypothetical protein
MKERSTRPVEIEGRERSNLAPWQLDEIAWSFGPAGRIVSSAPPSNGHSLPSSQNQAASSTIGPQKIKSPEREPTIVRRRDFGRRGFQALSSWEGVVEQVRDGKFRARLVPLSNGQPASGRVEFTDFSFEDLANESDVRLVEPGAVFYWTIGRARNAAGTVSNVSLVRFRRIPSPPHSRQQQARREARELMSALDDADGEYTSRFR